MWNGVESRWGFFLLIFFFHHPVCTRHPPSHTDKHVDVARHSLMCEVRRVSRLDHTPPWNVESRSTSTAGGKI
ncbi:hypothetical protein HOY82DRAFT_575016, partial [Tuber indicum]